MLYIYLCPKKGEALPFKNQEREKKNWKKYVLIATDL